MALIVGTLANDILPGTAGEDVIFGDGEDVLTHVQLGNGIGNDKILAKGGDFAIGDAEQLDDFSVGGNDTISSVGKYQNQLYGDAGYIHDGSAGGDDTLINSSPAGAFILGDGEEISFGSYGGDDTILNTGGRSALVGDSIVLTGEGALESFGGDDRITGGNNGDGIFGDAYYMAESYGGDDTLRGGSGEDYIVGDSETGIRGSLGGRDVINGGAGDDDLYGDFVSNELSDENDELSDGGNDIFEFSKGSGNDIIWDFDATGGDEHDLIDLTAYHLTWEQVSARMDPDDTDSVTTISLTKSDSIEVHHDSFVGDPGETDFIL